MIFEPYALAMVNPKTIDMKKFSSFILAVLAGTVTHAQSASESINTFAFDLYRGLKVGGNENLVYSPFSITPAFGMVTLGARGETLNQLNATFHFGNSPKFHQAVGKLQQSLIKSSSADITINVANKAWLQTDYKILKRYRCDLKGNYKTSLYKVDFINDPEAARKTINHAVEYDTQRHIKDLLPQGSISNLTRLVLTNAVYFKGKWKETFEPEKTKERDFTLADGSKTKHQFMSADKTFGYLKGTDFAALEMDYKGEELSMLLILPNEGKPLSEFEKAFTVEKYNEVVKAIEPQKTLVFIPRFTVESGFSMKKVLGEMGLTIPFSDDADFSGISGNKDLKISDAYHKAFIEVSEEGTTAAAATAVVVAMKSMPNFNVFDANRPFMFILRHKPTSTILFIGRVAKP
jgi:serpin B